MNGQELISLLKFRLGRGTGASSAFEGQLLSEIRLAQKRLEQSDTLPFFLRSEVGYIDLAEGEERTVLPDGFLREAEDAEMYLEIRGTKEIFPLYKTNLDVEPAKVYRGVLGRPKYYNTAGKYFRFAPAPDSGDYRLHMEFYLADVEITLEGTNQWLTHYPDLLMAEAGKVVAMILKNQAAAQSFAEMWQREMLRLTNSETARDMANFNPNPED